MADIPAQLQACVEYMTRFGLMDESVTRSELCAVLGLPKKTVDTFSRYGRLVPRGQGARVS